MKTPVYIRHMVGWCSVCGAPILDSGQNDDPRGWVHGWPWFTSPYVQGSHLFTFGPCALSLSDDPLRMLSRHASEDGTPSQA